MIIVTCEEQAKIEWVGKKYEMGRKQARQFLSYWPSGLILHNVFVRIWSMLVTFADPVK